MTIINEKEAPVTSVRRKYPYSGIYIITNKRTKKSYVGQSGNVYRRRKQHFSALKSGKHEN